MCENILVHSRSRIFRKNKATVWLKNITDHGCAHSTIQNVENKAMESTMRNGRSTLRALSSRLTKTTQDIRIRQMSIIN